MKCPECNGTGKVVHPMMSVNGDEYIGEWEQHDCEACNGTGEVNHTDRSSKMLNNEFKKSAIEKLKSIDSNELKKAFKEIGSEPETNEEWFCQLSTEEKAKVFANATYSTAETPLTILWGGKEAEQKKWELWLKAVHKE